MGEAGQGVPDLTVTTADGKRALPAGFEPAYSPPDRQKVAEVVANCEKLPRKLSHGRQRESELGALLRKASEQLYQGGSTDGAQNSNSIFPRPLLVEVFTRERIHKSLTFDKSRAAALLRKYGMDECVRWIQGNGGRDELGRFAHIFATLLLCNEELSIFDFFENELDDAAFPFVVAHNQNGDSGIGSSHSSAAEKFVDCGWNSNTCENIVHAQWRVFLPCFEQGRHYKFESGRAMPWHDCHLRVKTGASSTRTDVSGPGGGHSDVSRVFIYDGHYKFDFDRDLQAHASRVSFAVKKLKTTKQKDFDKEVAMLRKLGGRQTHTIKLLATFQLGETYCLLFPWAECDLMAYWKRHAKRPEMTPRLVRWVRTQYLGLARAVAWIHDPAGQVLDPEKNELFGRHGDIKAENILWFPPSSDSGGTPDMASGKLVLSDFGLSTLNHKNTCTNVANEGVLFTKTYAPPESVIRGELISRAIDIWALGCVYLEFAVWFNGGGDLVHKFQSERISPDFETKFGSDIFWDLQHVAGTDSKNPGHVRVIKSQVTQCIRDLRTDERATQYTQDFLDIIERDMLVVEKKKRILAANLSQKLEALDKKCHQNPAYCAAPSSTPPTRPAQHTPQIPILEHSEHLKPEVQILVARSRLRSYTGQTRSGSPETDEAGVTHVTGPAYLRP